MRLSDIKGEEAFDTLADIIEPLTIIFTDEEIVKISKEENAPPIKYVVPAIKNHKKEIIEVLARLENEPVEEYKKKVNLVSLPKQVLDLINDPEVQDLFTSQAQMTQLGSSGSAMENTEAKEN